MTRLPEATPTRRTVLSTVGAGIAAAALGTTVTANESAGPEHVLEQGDRCVPVRPLEGEEPVQAFYEYVLPEKYVSDENGAVAGTGNRYASAGTTALQRAQTSIAFLYEGPERLSLVVVHGSVENDDAGSVTFRLSGLPADGEWLVKDDRYRDPDTGDLASTNYDRWDVDGTEHTVDWTWGSSGTDGGVFGDLGDDFEVVVEPAFNDAATLSDEHYEGTVTDWEFLAGSPEDPERVALAMGEPIRIRTGNCDDSGAHVEETETDDGTESGDGETENADEEAEESATGDEEEEDEEEEDEEEQDEDDEYTVCHRPPGNPDNAHTKRVGSESALESHLAHGDSKGPCPGDE